MNFFPQLYSFRRSSYSRNTATTIPRISITPKTATSNRQFSVFSFKPKQPLQLQQQIKRSFVSVAKSRSLTDRNLANNQYTLPAVWEPKVDIREDPDAYFIHLDVPGFKKDDLRVVLYQDHWLKVSGERQRSDTPSGR